MATASAVLDDIRVRFGDTNKDLISDANGLEWLDQAQKQFTWEMRSLKRFKGLSVSANQDSFAIEDDTILLEGCFNHQQLKLPLKRITPAELRQQQVLLQNAVGTPIAWTQLDKRVYVWPRYSTASKTTTVNASTTDTATTIVLASTGNLRAAGLVQINSEDIEYAAKTATSITGCRRGIGGTTAASHASGDTVTQLDFEMIYSRHSATLASQTDELEIQEIFHKPLLQYYVMYLAYMAEGSSGKAQAMHELWRREVQRAQDVAKRRHAAGPLHIADMDTQRISGLYGPII